MPIAPSTNLVFGPKDPASPADTEYLKHCAAQIDQ
jgi:hypothetical protein